MLNFSIIKAEKFLKSYPQCKGIINGIVSKFQRYWLRPEDGNNTDELVEKCKNFYDYDTANFKKLNLPGFKYKLQLLNEDCPDHVILQSSLVGTNSEEEKLFWSRFDLIDESKAVKIYRVVPSDEAARAESCAGESLKTILLLHGASATNVEGILKTGFKPSQGSKLNYGPGVYNSNCVKSEYRCGFNTCHAQDQDVVKKLTYTFVNQVTVPDGYSPANELKSISYEDYLKNEPGLQVIDVNIYFDHFDKGCMNSEPGTFQDCPNNKFDSAGSKILNGTFHRNNSWKKVVAHHDLVKPAYLLEIAEKPATEQIIDELFSRSCASYHHKDLTERNFESFTKELRKKMADWKLKHTSFDQFLLIEDIHRAVEQLSFNLNSLLEAKDDAKYWTELLQQQDDDYQFVMKLIENKGSKKVKNVFRINPVDESGALSLKDKYLYFHGVTSKEVGDILENGYPRDGKWENTTCESICNKGDLYAKESYCMDGNVPRKRSFAFISSSGVDCEEFRMGDSEFVRDSRGICVDVGKSNNRLFTNRKTPDRWVKVACGRAPAYLMIF